MLVKVLGQSKCHVFQTLSHQLESLLVLQEFLIFLIFLEQHVVIVTDDDVPVVQVKPATDQVSRLYR